MRLRGDEAPRHEDPVDGRGRGDLAPGGGHVEVDCLGPGVEAALGELLSDAHDLVLVEVGDTRWTGLGPPRAGLEPGRALEAIAARQLEEPALAHLMRRRQHLDGPAGPQVRLDQELALVHRRPLPVRTLLCLDTCPGQELSYVLNSDTVGAASNFLVREFHLIARFHPVHPVAHRAGELMGRVCAEFPDETGRADPGVSAAKEWRRTGASLSMLSDDTISQGPVRAAEGGYEYPT